MAVAILAPAMAQERPAEVNAFLTRWLAAEFPQVWPKDAQP